MQLEQFLVPIGSDKSLFENVNKFLRSNRILDIKKEFVNCNNGIFWAICVTYLPTPQLNIDRITAGGGTCREKIDYKSVLTEQEFERFTEFRKIRKLLSADDAVPPYAVFTDAELAEIAKHENINKSILLSISGIGKKKVEKYGEQLCTIYSTRVNELNNEESREFKESDC